MKTSMLKISDRYLSMTEIVDVDIRVGRIHKIAAKGSHDCGFSDPNESFCHTDGTW
jgi:hypothetical protein